MKARLRYWYVSVEVSFRRPLPVTNEKGAVIKGKHALGFVREFGYTAKTQELMQSKIEEMIYKDFLDNVEAIKFDWIGEIEDVEKDIFKDEDIGQDNLLQSPYEEGLWYSTGYAFWCGRCKRKAE